MTIIPMVMRYLSAPGRVLRIADGVVAGLVVAAIIAIAASSITPSPVQLPGPHHAERGEIYSMNSAASPTMANTDIVGSDSLKERIIAGPGPSEPSFVVVNLDNAETVLKLGNGSSISVRVDSLNDLDDLIVVRLGRQKEVALWPKGESEMSYHFSVRQGDYDIPHQLELVRRGRNIDGRAVRLVEFEPKHIPSG